MVAGVFTGFNEGGVESSISSGVELDPNSTEKVVQTRDGFLIFEVEAMEECSSFLIN